MQLPITRGPYFQEIPFPRIPEAGVSASERRSPPHRSSSHPEDGDATAGGGRARRPPRARVGQAALMSRGRCARRRPTACGGPACPAARGAACSPVWLPRARAAAGARMAARPARAQARLRAPPPARRRSAAMVRRPWRRPRDVRMALCRTGWCARLALTPRAQASPSGRWASRSSRACRTAAGAPLPRPAPVYGVVQGHPGPALASAWRAGGLAAPQRVRDAATRSGGFFDRAGCAPVRGVDDRVPTAAHLVEAGF